MKTKSLMRMLLPIAGILLMLGASLTAGDVWKTDPFTGDYQGNWAKGTKVWPAGLVAQVIPRGGGKFLVNFLPEFDKRCPPYSSATAELEGSVLVISGDGWSGRVVDGVMTGTGTPKGKHAAFELRKVERPSPRLGAKAPQGAVVLFDGTNVDQWTGIDNKGTESEVTWKIVDSVLEVAPTMKEHGFATSIATKECYLDYHLHLEFRLPFFPEVLGQGRGNSGVIFEDYTFYELQVLDSYGLPGYYDECGGVYNIAGPHANLCRPPTVWQSYDIEYRAPRYAEDGALIRAGRLTVDHNGVRIQTDLDLPDTGLKRRQQKPGSRKVGRLTLQNHGDPVQYRNIWLKKLTPEKAEQ